MSWLMALMLGGGVGLPLGVPPLPEDPRLANVAPEECLAYFASGGMAKPQASSPNQTEQLFAEPEPSGGDPDRIARHRRVPFFHIMEWQKPD